MWLLQPAPTPFLVPGATDIQVSSTGWGERQISYRTPGRPYGWYFTLAHMLDAQPWTLRNPWRPDGSTPTYDPVVPLRFECGYAGVLWDEGVALLSASLAASKSNGSSSVSSSVQLTI